MKLIISPAKKMRVNSDDIAAISVPIYLNQAEELKAWINKKSLEEQKTLWQCNEEIAKENHERFATMDLHNALTPAILAYDGIQYQYMAPRVFEDDAFSYVDDNLRILSGFYGVMRPMDGVVPYRLEMQAKDAPGNCKNLYEYWGDSLYRGVMDESGVIINLASEEYAKAVKRYLQPEDRFVTFVFGELSGEKVIQKGVYVKMARGEMVRYAATIKANHPEDLKNFVGQYSFDEKRSSDQEYVFLK